MGGWLALLCAVALAWSEPGHGASVRRTPLGELPANYLVAWRAERTAVELDKGKGVSIRWGGSPLPPPPARPAAHHVHPCHSQQPLPPAGAATTRLS